MLEASIRPMNRSTLIMDVSLLDVKPSVLRCATDSFGGMPVVLTFCSNVFSLP